MDLQEMKTRFAGKHVKFTGMFSNVDGPTGKVWRVTTRGIWVTLADGSRQQWHPESITVVPALKVRARR